MKIFVLGMCEALSEEERTIVIQYCHAGLQQ